MTVPAAPRIGTPIRSPAGHVWPFARTERRVMGLLDRLPITRVYDATALDRLGLPVWGAVTPLARGLTVHAGKGITAQAARISAVMEAIERVSAEEVAPERVRRASFHDLTGEAPGRVVDPAECDLAFDSRYHPRARCGWVAGEDLHDGEPTWAALDLVISPACEGVCRGPATNGLAAGNTRPEATLHALYEVIERDADAHRRFLDSYGDGEERVGLRLLRNESLPDPAGTWVDRLHALGLFVGIEELTHDIGVPVYRAILSDRAFPGREGTSAAFEGLGCDLDAANAVMRALTEAVQAHTTVLLGARDQFDGGQPAPLSPARFLARLATPSHRVTFHAAPPSDDLATRLEITLGRLRAVGLARAVVVDLTRSDLGVPVVRVLVPGAAGPDPAGRRQVPARLLRHLV